MQKDTIQSCTGITLFTFPSILKTSRELRLIVLLLRAADGDADVVGEGVGKGCREHSRPKGSGRSRLLPKLVWSVVEVGKWGGGRPTAEQRKGLRTVSTSLIEGKAS